MWHGRIKLHIQRQICAIMHCELDQITEVALPVQQQTNGVDCGIYALANIIYLLGQSLFTRGGF